MSHEVPQYPTSMIVNYVLVIVPDAPPGVVVEAGRSGGHAGHWGHKLGRGDPHKSRPFVTSTGVVDDDLRGNEGCRVITYSCSKGQRRYGRQGWLRRSAGPCVHHMEHALWALRMPQLPWCGMWSCCDACAVLGFGNLFCIRYWNIYNLLSVGDGFV